MNDDHIQKLASILDNTIWRNPQQSIIEALNYYRTHFEMRPTMGTGDRPYPCPPDYRDVAKSLIRSGTELTKEEKKRHGIHLLTKATTSVFNHFTDYGLTYCSKEAQILALAVGSIEITLDKLNDWGKWGEKKIGFSPAPDACPICMVVKGVYLIGKSPIPVLDTHLECRCSILPLDNDQEAGFLNGHKAKYESGVFPMKRCPHCSEWIEGNALKCKHCNKELLKV